MGVTRRTAQSVLPRDPDLIAISRPAVARFTDALKRLNRKCMTEEDAGYGSPYRSSDGPDAVRRWDVGSTSANPVMSGGSVAVACAYAK